MGIVREAIGGVKLDASSFERGRNITFLISSKAVDKTTGKLVTQGLFATGDRDYVGDVFTLKALQSIARDLSTKNSTALWMHEPELSVGSVKWAKAYMKGDVPVIEGAVELSNRDDEFMRGIRQDVEDGHIRKFSIRFRAKTQDIQQVERNGEPCWVIDDAEGIEVSLVSVAMNENCEANKVEWVMAKSAKGMLDSLSAPTPVEFDTATIEKGVAIIDASGLDTDMVMEFAKNFYTLPLTRKKSTDVLGAVTQVRVDGSNIILDFAPAKGIQSLDGEELSVITMARKDAKGAFSALARPAMLLKEKSAEGEAPPPAAAPAPEAPSPAATETPPAPAASTEAPPAPADAVPPSADPTPPAEAVVAPVADGAPATPEAPGAAPTPAATVEAPLAAGDTTGAGTIDAAKAGMPPDLEDGEVPSPIKEHILSIHTMIAGHGKAIGGCQQKLGSHDAQMAAVQAQVAQCLAAQLASAKKSAEDLASMQKALDAATALAADRKKALDDWAQKAHRLEARLKSLESASNHINGGGDTGGARPVITDNAKTIHPFRSPGIIPALTGSAAR